MSWRNLAPDLVRQRVIIEGLTKEIVEPPLIGPYLLGLSETLNMAVRGEPLTYSAEDKPDSGWTALNMGYAGWLYWVSSGVHFHSYPTEPPLFTVDAYTCKRLDVQHAVRFTKEFLAATDIVWREILD